MAIRQSDYVKFYYDVREKITDIVKEREGITMIWSDPISNDSVGHNAMERPYSSTNNPPNTCKSGISTPKEEPISLNDLLYGNYIDSKYKELFKIFCSSDGYVKNQMSDFIYRVAMDVYNTFLGKKELDRILDKVRTTGYDSLTKEEKKMLFSSRK